MALVVQKFGGTSVGSIDRIRNVARRAIATQSAGHRVVLIVSAMSGETNRLLGLAHEVAKVPDAREMDAIAATGEQVSAALTAHGHPGRGRQGALAARAPGEDPDRRRVHQGAHQDDRGLEDLRDARARRDRRRRRLPGRPTTTGNITTLGRGGSDTSAVAVAAAIGADECEIYTDVDGVYTTDPNVCPSARKIDRISYEEMLELASLGAKVLQIRSVEIAMKYGVPVHVRSSFNDTPGTIVTKEDAALEGVVVSGVAYDKGEARVHVVGVDDKPGVAAELFERIAEKNISVDMIVQNVTTERRPAREHHLHAREDRPRAREAVDRGGRQEPRRARGALRRGRRQGVDRRPRHAIARRHRGARCSASSPTRASTSRRSRRARSRSRCLVAAKYTELAVRALHDGFGLGR